MSAETYRYEHYDPGGTVRGNSGGSGASTYNGQGPAAVTITGTRLGPFYWWWDA